MLRLLNILSIILLSSLGASAQLYEAKPTNTAISITVSDTSPNEMFLVFRESNKQKQNFQLKLNGPTGLKISINSALTLPAQDSLAAAVGPFVYPSRIFVNNSGSLTYKVGGGAGNSNDIRDPNCGCLTGSDIQNYLDLLAQYGQSMTREQLCQQVGPIPGGVCNLNPDTGYNPDGQIILQSFISRNQCSNAHHLTIVKLDLSEVDKSAGGEILLKAAFKLFKGKKASSIKERGDGMYPQPLLLASPVSGGYFGTSDHSIRLSKWQGTNRTSSTQIQVADMVYYGPVGALLRIPLAYSQLNGGKGTFEVSKNGLGYSMCAKLVAKRQYFYGYTN